VLLRIHEPSTNQHQLVALANDQAPDLIKAFFSKLVLPLNISKKNYLQHPRGEMSGVTPRTTKANQ